MKKDNQTNVEFVEDMMTFSSCGALIQLYVLEALRIYSEQVLDDVRFTSDDGTSMINNLAWRRCAQEVKDKIDARYLSPR